MISRVVTGFVLLLAGTCFLGASMIRGSSSTPDPRPTQANVAPALTQNPAPRNAAPPSDELAAVRTPVAFTLQTNATGQLVSIPCPGALRLGRKLQGGVLTSEVLITVAPASPGPVTQNLRYRGQGNYVFLSSPGDWDVLLTTTAYTGPVEVLFLPMDTIQFAAIVDGIGLGTGVASLVQAVGALTAVPAPNDVELWALSDLWLVNDSAGVYRVRIGEVAAAGVGIPMPAGSSLHLEGSTLAGANVSVFNEGALPGTLYTSWVKR